MKNIFDKSEKIILVLCLLGTVLCLYLLNNLELLNFGSSDNLAQVSIGHVQKPRIDVRQNDIGKPPLRAAEALPFRLQQPDHIEHWTCPSWPRRDGVTGTQVSKAHRLPCGIEQVHLLRINRDLEFLAFGDRWFAIE